MSPEQIICPNSENTQLEVKFTNNFSGPPGTSFESFRQDKHNGANSTSLFFLRRYRPKTYPQNRKTFFLMTSADLVLTSDHNDRYKNGSSVGSLSNAIYLLSLRSLLLEIVRAGSDKAL